MEDLFESQNDAGFAARPFRVVHSADWHLGKTLGDLSREEEHERFLRFLVQTVAAERADLLVIAGDIFDSANPPQSALRQYYTFLSELRQTTRCQVLVVAGNHDSPVGLDAPKHLLEALDITVVGAAPQGAEDAVFLFPNKRKPVLAVAAIPFLRDRDLRGGVGGQSAADIRRALVDGITQRYRDAEEAVQSIAPELPALATGHLTVQGSTASDSEREIHIGGLGAVGVDLFPARFDYIALGHLHRPQACGGRDQVRYAGSPIPLSFSEAEDHKELRILEFTNGRLAVNRSVKIPLWRPLAQLRCARDEVADTVAGFSPPPSELPAWVELVVDSPLLGEDVFATASEAAAGRGFEIVRVIAARGRVAVLGSNTDMDTKAAADDELLADPAQVFGLRLDDEESLDGEERDALRLAFQALLESHQQHAAEA